MALVWDADDRSALQPADPKPTATASVAADPETAWTAFLADHPGAPHSSVLTAKDASYGTYANGPDVHVLSFGGQVWRDLWTGSVSRDVTTVALANLTGAPVPDVVVGTSAASVVPTSVLRSDGSGWVPVSFLGCGGPTCASTVVTEVPNGRVIAGRFVSTYNACTPTCASNTPRDVSWAFNSGQERFEVVVGSGACDPTARVVIWDVTDAVLVNGLVQVEYRVDTVACGTADDVTYEPTGAVRHATLAADAHVEVLPPNGAPTSTVIAPDELPQELLPGMHRTFAVMLTGGSVTSLVQQYHP